MIPTLKILINNITTHAEFTGGEAVDELHWKVLMLSWYLLYLE